MIPPLATSAPRRSISRSAPADLAVGVASATSRWKEVLPDRAPDRSFPARQGLRFVHLGKAGLAGLRGRRHVAGSSAPAGLGVHDPDRSLLADELAVEAQALVAEALDHARNHIAMRAEHGVAAVQLGEQRQRAGGGAAGC
jgi:hypothetical protein